MPIDSTESSEAQAGEAEAPAVKKTYTSRTYNSKNPLRRFAHRTRMRLNQQFITLADGAEVVDFGCGDALFLNQLAESSEAKDIGLLGFEPFLESIPDNQVPVVKEWSEVEARAAENGGFDYATCFEVFEHFNPTRQAEALGRIADVLKPSGRLVVSVPVESGLASVVKNTIRRIDHPHVSHIYSFRNIFRSAFGLPIPEHRSSDDYLAHMGFYHKDLQRVFDERFTILKRRFSPFPWLPSGLNSQVFYLLQPKK